MRVLESVGLLKPMIHYIDNKVAVDFSHNWSSSGRMRHACVKLSFLRELKDEGIVTVEWCKSEDMPADLFTKNLSEPSPRKDIFMFCGEDDYD
jgi:hypothetical protein